MASVDRPAAPDDFDLRRDPLEAEKSLGQLFSDMTTDLGTLMRKEVELAKVETKEEVARAGKAGAMLAGGGVAAHTALLFLSFAVAWLLDEFMHTAVAFLIVGLIYAVAAAVLLSRGREQVKQVNPVPQQTVETLKEDAQWARAQRS